MLFIMVYLHSVLKTSLLPWKGPGTLILRMFSVVVISALCKPMKIRTSLVKPCIYGPTLYMEVYQAKHVSSSNCVDVYSFVLN